MSDVDFIDIVQGRFAKTSRADLTAFFASLGDEKLVLHFHGGLVSRASAHKTAASLELIYTRSNSRPLFVIWNSDLKTTLQKNLKVIAAESIFWTIVSRIAAILDWKESIDSADMSGRHGVQNASIRFAGAVHPKKLKQRLHARAMPQSPKRLSQRERNEIADALVRDPILRRQIQRITPATPGARGAQGRGYKTQMSPSVVRKLSQGYATQARSLAASPFIIKKMIGALIAIIRRLRKNTDHGVYVTIVEEVLRAFYFANVGRAVWLAMKHSISNSFQADPDVFGGTALVNALRTWWTPNRQLLLVGHSAGSIYILDLVAQLSKTIPSLRAEIVFMAPACTLKKFLESAGPFSKVASSFRMYTLSDLRERGYSEVPVIYRASLLYMVSGILEDKADMPILGMQRYYSNKKPYLGPEFQATATATYNCICYSPSMTPPQLLCQAERHGGFTGDADMRQSLADIVARGIQ